MVLIYEHLQEILEFNNIHQDLYFTTLQPIEFTQLDNISTKIRREKKKQGRSCLAEKELDDFSEEDGDDMLRATRGIRRGSKR